MSTKNELTFYLEPKFRARAQAGQVNFVNQIADVFRSANFSVDFSDNLDLAVLQSAQRRGYAMFHMEHPFHSQALTMRKVYCYPFWRIEKTHERWNWIVAKTDFDPNSIDPETAEKFVQQWRKRLFGEEQNQTVGENQILIPLQGQLMRKRSFQSCSPIKMIEATLDADKNRDIILAMHPREQYSDIERETLRRLVKCNSRLRIVEHDINALVQSCDYIVTQNSSVAMTGFFHRKPAILFAKTDFHHIAANVQQSGIDGAFGAVLGSQIDFDRYLYWFLQEMSINAGHENAKERILKTVRDRGWIV